MKLFISKFFFPKWIGRKKLAFFYSYFFFFLLHFFVYVLQCIND